MAELKVISKILRGHAFDLSAESFTIGRADDNTICLDHTSVSKHHAILTVDGNDFKLSDLQSTNGTIVNGHPIATARLREGDRLLLGEVELCFALREKAGSQRTDRPVAPPKKTEPALVIVGSSIVSPSTPVPLRTPKPDEAPPPPIAPAHGPRKVVRPALYAGILGLGALLWIVGYAGQNNALRFFGILASMTGLLCLVFRLRYGSLLAPPKRQTPAN